MVSTLQDGIMVYLENNKQAHKILSWFVASAMSHKNLNSSSIYNSFYNDRIGIRQSKSLNEAKRLVYWEPHSIAG